MISKFQAPYQSTGGWTYLQSNSGAGLGSRLGDPQAAMQKEPLWAQAATGGAGTYFRYVIQTRMWMPPPVSCASAETMQ